ncbi:hypothetical protein DCS_06407 [Drechmeria coniospora]|uniref:Histone transcription regulator 3 homolog n=1 Tax=Drechmeria coniospora TaxID=98403 RepID=A0A151GBG2_DRECN|nr:hypothetical protein DCS_06407 [Drechmeria coniospora]KYK54449.1 hypothetical protein DCS_06407 [Drechmeria coniospora]
MPAFQAINIEAEENVDEKVDTTKELHVDEALKRFQAALKLHAQGPRSREAAGAAYEELFESKIFEYQEARSDYERAERHAEGRPELTALESFWAGLSIDAGGEAEGVAANLSQALYISYKNYGQFFLDKIKDASSRSAEWRTKARIRYHDDDANKVMDNWSAALDQDPSDPELWRKMGRFAASMNSGRIKRYCLEAAVELDDDPAVTEINPPSLAEGFAGEQLKDYLNVLDDSIAISHPVMAPWMDKAIPDWFKRHIDPISTLPDPTATLTPPPSSPLLKPIDGADTDETLPEAISSWTDFGMELLKCQNDTDGALRACRLVLKAALDNKMDVDTESIKETSQDAEKLASLEIKAGGDVKMMDEAERQATRPTDDGSKRSDPPKDGESSSMSTRKRSQSTAGLQDGAEEETGAEKRSKRVRRRTEARDAEETTDPSVLIANQIKPYQEADLNLFQTTKSMFESLGIDDKDTLGCLQELLESCATEDRTSTITRQAGKDLRSVMTGFSEETAMVLLNKKEQATLGLSSFLEHTKSGSQEEPAVPTFGEAQGLGQFADMVVKHDSWMTSDDISFEWVRAFSESYATSKWPDPIKVAVVQMLNRVDPVLHQRITDELELHSGSPEKLVRLEALIEMLFELHIDIYERITNPSSVVDYATRMSTKYRLDRWLDVASTYVRLQGRPSTDPLCVRFLWGSVMTSSLAENPAREHIRLLWTSLRDFLSAHPEIQAIYLPNNVVMPTISTAAADREISKLTTMDFFLGLFQEEVEDPVHVIETLEPVLNPSSVFMSAKSSDGVSDDDASTDAEVPAGLPLSECAAQDMRDLWKFLDGSSTELRLFLWSRLGDAYASIKYPTKRFSCLLKSIELIVTDLESDTYAKTPDGPRKLLFMRTLKTLDDLLIQALTSGLNDGNAFDIIDDEHLKSSACAIAKVSCMLHVAPLCEDEVRLGMATAPSNNSTFMSLVNKLREMQVRSWSLQYAMLKAGLREDVDSRQNDLTEFLAVVHQAIGLRKFCKSSNKVFLKMMRLELLKFDSVETWEDHLGQVVYDLNGLKLGVGIGEVQDHGCPYEKLEKRQAMQLVKRVMFLANRMPMKDLLKSDLKTTIEHMQQTIGQPKSTPQMIHNLRSFTEFLKKPIHPLRIYQALSGGVTADSVGANIPEAVLAKHGWFFLLGMIALTKFKGVELNRRQTPGATDDLRIGATFLRLQLQFTADNWESWFRLAECFDYELDESVLWSADKMNKDRAELVKFQRSAIHCYTLALSHSRHIDIAVTDGDPLHDLYHKFAMRMYSSSREPFAMEPFQHSDQERFFIESMGAGTFKNIIHEQMSDYKVWKFAAQLFRMAMKRNPRNWKNPYMLAKCYWKMYKTPSEKLDKSDKPVDRKVVIDSLKRSIEVAMGERRSRSSDPILEPHYKMASVLHKMVTQGDMPAKDAASILSEQPFGVAVNPEDHYASFLETADWEEYIIPNLIKLKDKDKSNWHHRIVIRHARIVFDEANLNESNDGQVEAQAAFTILRENMFTKTMVMSFKVEPASDDAFKSLSNEEFEIIGERISTWAAGDGPHIAALSCMKEAVELKKLNSNLMKVTPIDDLINDCYTTIYLDIAGSLPGMEPSRVIAERNQAKEIAAQLEAVAQADAKQPKSTSDTPHVNSGQNGVTETATPLDAEKAETVPRARRAVRRPDILRKAEQAVTRAMDTPKTASKSRVSSVTSKRGSQTPAAAVSGARSDDDGPDAQVRREAGEDFDEGLRDAGTRKGSRARRDTALGSGQDSADDSDLSDVPEGYDEDVPPGLLFPNLGRSRPNGGMSGEEADSESEGDEEVEETMEQKIDPLGLHRGHDGREEEEEEAEGDEEVDEVVGEEGNEDINEEADEEVDDEVEEEVEEDDEEDEEEAGEKAAELREGVDEGDGDEGEEGGDEEGEEEGEDDDGDEEDEDEAEDEVDEADEVEEGEEDEEDDADGEGDGDGNGDEDEDEDADDGDEDEEDDDERGQGDDEGDDEGDGSEGEEVGPEDIEMTDAVGERESDTESCV